MTLSFHWLPLGPRRCLALGANVQGLVPMIDTLVESPGSAWLPCMLVTLELRRAEGVTLFSLPFSLMLPTNLTPGLTKRHSKLCLQDSTHNGPQPSVSGLKGEE